MPKKITKKTQSRETLMTDKFAKSVTADHTAMQEREERSSSTGSDGNNHRQAKRSDTTKSSATSSNLNNKQELARMNNKEKEKTSGVQKNSNLERNSLCRGGTVIKEAKHDAFQEDAKPAQSKANDSSIFLRKSSGTFSTHTPSRSISVTDVEDRVSLSAPPRKSHQRQLRQADEVMPAQDFSSAMAVAQNDPRKYNAKVSTAPGSVECSCKTLTHDVPRDFTTSNTPGDYKGQFARGSHLSLGASEQDHQALPGAVRVRGSSYRSGRSAGTPLYGEARDNHGMPPDIVVSQINLQESQAEEGMVSAYAVDDSSLVHEAVIVNVKRQRMIRILVFAALIMVVIAVIVPVVLTAGNKSDSGSHAITFSPIIVNLCSPRHMTVHDNKLYVPEAGVGPIQIAGDRETPPLCLDSSLAAIPGGICFGKTGQVKAYNLDGLSLGEPLLQSIFSARPTSGGFTNQVYGASGVDFAEDGSMYTMLGLGYVNASELAIKDPELVFGSVLRDDETVASPWVKVFENRYPGAAIESNPFHLFIHNGITYAVDSGANLLYTYLDVNTAGIAEPDSVIVLPTIDNIPAVKPDPRGGPCTDVVPPAGPSFCGKYQDEEGEWLYSADAVPTAVRIDPREPNRIYVSYLSGAIWNEPVSGLFTMDLVHGLPQNDTLKAIMGGLWAVVDFDFYENSVYILETQAGGFVPFGGRLSKISIDSAGSILSKEVITEDLFQPVGMTIHNGIIYVSNNTFNMGIDDCNGEILSASLR